MKTIDDISITDEQYRKLLLKIRETVNAPNFKPDCEDSTTIGAKHTISNCGLCNDDYTDIDTAMWPEEFKKYGRKSMKYTKRNHKCPFDLRPNTCGPRYGDDKIYPTDYSGGCFYHCFIFGQSKAFREFIKDKQDMPNLTLIRKLVDDTIAESEALLKR